MYALVYLPSGGGRFKDTLGADRRVRTGDLLCIHPDVGHQYGPEKGDQWNELYICFKGPAFDAWKHPEYLDPGKPVWHLEPVEYWYGRFLDLLREERPAINVCAQLHTLLADAWQSSRKGKADWIEEAKRALEAPSNGGHSSLEKLARHCGLPYETFRKKFRQATGKSPGIWRRDHLIGRAGDLIRRSQLTNEAIAEQLGFCDAFHFSKAFKQATGKSPSAFRKGTTH